MKNGRIVFDTCVWLDYFLDRSERGNTVASLIDAIREQGSVIVVSQGTLKDLFYIIPVHLKRLAGRDQQAEINAATLREIAWKCIREVTRLALIADQNPSLPLHAISLRTYHDDLEDNLIIALSQQIDAVLLVTEDVELQKNAPVACLSAKDALSYLQTAGTA